MRLAVTRAAAMQLREVRRALRSVGADQAADAVQRALNSTEGAVRHAQRLRGEELRQGQAIHHLDGNSRNNDLANLQLVDWDENRYVPHSLIRIPRA
jgi:hypothetical protein